MTVEPGFGGQAFMPDMLEKVKFLRESARKLSIEVDIQVDGGINYETAKVAVESGANRLVTGTHFFNETNKKTAMAKYNELRKFYK
jgi:ribulose-phosphate 3-epimerase